MATAVIMPRQGQSVESCIIGMWHKKVGDRVSVGDDLFTYETDKAAFDEAAKVGGELLAVLFNEGDDVPCLSNVCVIGERGEDISAFLAPGDASPAAAEVVAAAPVFSGPAPEVPQASVDPLDLPLDLPISPRAKALARKQTVDLRAVVPTGPKNRVIERDVVKLIADGRFATGAVGTAYSPGTAGTGIGGRVSAADLDAPQVSAPASAAAPALSSTEEKHSNIRKLIAKSMVHSLSTMAQLTYNASFDASDIIELRARLKRARESGLAGKIGLPENVTINDIILYTVSRVVKNHKMCNAHYFDDRMVFFNQVNIGVAVDTPRGLMVPTIFNADRLSVDQLEGGGQAVDAEDAGLRGVDHRGEGFDAERA